MGEWSGSGTAIASIGMSGVAPGYQQPVPLALDSSADPVAMYAQSVVRGAATPEYSPFEESGTTQGSLAMSGDVAWLAYSHAGQLEVAHAALGGYWSRALLGPVDDAHTGVAIDGAGIARVCFFRGGKLMLY